MKEFKPKNLFRFGLLLYFLIPYFLFLKFFEFSFNLNLSEISWAVRNSLLQAGLTAAIVMALAIPMSQGLFLLSGKLQKTVLRLLIVPQILPALYSILIALSVINPYPMGSLGIIILFVFINLGFGTLLMFGATREKLGSLPLISEVYSLGRFNFFRTIYFPLLKFDLIMNFFMIFVFCLSSFSVPLIVGGGRGTNIEVLIYEKIFVDQNWPAAFSLCLTQALLIFGVSALLFRNRQAIEVTEFSSGRYLKSGFGLLLIGVYLLVYFGGYAIGLFKSLSYFDFIFEYRAELLEVTLFTTKALFLYLVVSFALLLLWLLDYLENFRFTPANNLISPSTVLVGFTLYLFLPVTKDFDIVKIILAMSILFFPSLFKLFLQQPIENLKQQLLISKIYGLSKPTIIFEIIFRQIPQKLYLWASMLILWFIADYALLKALGVQTPTLGLFSEKFLSSYRLALSYFMSFYILVYWLLAMVSLFIFQKVLYVTYQKIKS